MTRGSAFFSNCKTSKIPFLSLEENVWDISLLNNDFSNLDKVITSKSTDMLKEVKGIEKDILEQRMIMQWISSPLLSLLHFLISDLYFWQQSFTPIKTF
jgi:hypothetical protein